MEKFRQRIVRLLEYQEQQAEPSLSEWSPRPRVKRPNLHNSDIGAHIPSPKEIQLATKNIQKNWTKAQRDQRIRRAGKVKI